MALRLVGLTFLYNLAEGVISIAFGVRAGSISLVGFGGDSFIECAAAAVVWWRMRLETAGADEARLDAAERRVHRFVGGTFMLLALYVTAQAAWTLWTQAAPEESWVGIAVAVASLIVMPPVAWAKLRLARRLESPALAAEAKETLACSYLSFVLLAGLGLNAGLGWWWADPVAALLMVPWLLREGAEGLKGEACG